MFFTCVFVDRRIFLDDYFKIYLVFVFGFGLSSIVTGYLPPFISNLIGAYFVAYIGYWSTKLLVEKYDGLRFFVNLFVIVGLVNAIVTIGQYMYIPFTQVIPDILHTRMDRTFAEAVEMERNLSGIAVPGLIGDDVYNGYFLMVSVIISLFYQKDGIKFIYLIPWAIFCIALYMNQERAAFFLALGFSVFILSRIISSGQGKEIVFQKIVLYVVVLIGLFVLVDFMLSGTTRFSLGFDGTNRASIYRKAFQYINDHIIFGGLYLMLDTLKLYPHNVLINAWIYGGFMGFVAIFVMLCKQAVQVLKLCFRRLTSLGISYLVVGLAFAAFTLNSFLHNASVVSGDIVVWLLWGAFLMSTSKKEAA